MAIVNRTKDASEQRVVFQAVAGAVATGVTGIVGLVPWPATLDAAQIAAFTISGSPTYALTVNRFIAGTGATAIIVATGTSNIPASFGTSGPGAFGASLFGASGMVIAASGSTLLNLLANDVIMYTSGVANTAATGLAISVAIKPTQDIKVHYGLV